MTAALYVDVRGRCREELRWKRVKESTSGTSERGNRLCRRQCLEVIDQRTEDTMATKLKEGSHRARARESKLKGAALFVFGRKITIGHVVGTYSSADSSVDCQ
jgi:hypothetical protein